MKKILFLSTILASSVLLSSCEDNLDIAQHGVTPIENFYQTDDDAEQAMVAAYQGFQWNMTGFEGGSIYCPFRFCFNLCADDLFAAGEFLGDNDFAGAMNEFRYDSGSDVVRNAYQNIYYAMYYSNLVIDKFKDGLPNGAKTNITKRVVAESRVLRAYMHFMLGIGWGTPPQADGLFAADALPANSDHDALLKWCAEECVAAVADLDKRQGPSDKNGAAKVTQGFANALAGKIYLFLGDYENAKTYLKKVIDSGDYALVPGTEFAGNFHEEGDLSSEKVFEINLDRDPNITDVWGSTFINRTTWMEANIWNWRSDHFKANPSFMYASVDGWGGCGVPQAFADAFVENDGPDSYRLKASIVSIDDVAFGNVAGFGNDFDKLTPEQKLASADLGLDNRGLYGQSTYLPLKPVCKKTDLRQPFENYRVNNFVIMRYAEVLLNYAEACIQTGAASEALTYINKIQERANSKTISTSADMNVLKKEKQFEMWLEGCRWPDMCRWGDFEVAKTAGKKVTELHDKVNRPLKSGETILNESPSGRFYTIASASAAPGATGRDNCGFKDYQKLFPFPNTVLSLNPNLVQNPGW